MLRTIAVLGFLLGLAGCGDPGGAREVPVSDSRADPSPDAGATTKPSRAIATH
jgi:hypothetical protein